MKGQTEFQPDKLTLRFSSATEVLSSLLNSSHIGCKLPMFQFDIYTILKKSKIKK